MHAAPARRSLTRRAVLVAVTVLALATAVLGMETAYALWQDRAEVEAGPVATGTAALTAEWSSEKDAADWQNLLPGDQVQRNVIVTNTGDVPLTLTASTTSAVFDVRLSEPDPVLGPGEDAVLHIELSATTDLVPGTQSRLETQIEGRQAT